MDTDNFYNDILGYDVPESVYWTFNNLLLDDKLALPGWDEIPVLTQRRPYKVYKSFTAETLHVIRDSVPNWHVQLWALEKKYLTKEEQKRESVFAKGCSDNNFIIGMEALRKDLKL